MEAPSADMEWVEEAGHDFPSELAHDPRDDSQTSQTGCQRGSTTKGADEAMEQKPGREGPG